MSPSGSSALPTCDIVFLCTEDDLTRERAGMWESLQSLATVRVLPARLGTSAEILEWLHVASPPAATPILIWPDPHGAAPPEGLAACDALTACWQIDSFSAPEWRAEQARLFDVTFVFHPGSVDRFAELGVHDVHLIPHAVRRRFFPAGPSPKSLDVAFVGSLAGPYGYRRACLDALAADGWSMNDFRRHHEYAELADTYRTARIGLNVPQDTYLRDANLRCFEVMAANAVLLTPAGSELAGFGFVPGRHYVEFSGVEELRDTVRRLLRSDAERAELADAAQRRVLTGFTYDQVAREMLRVLKARSGKPRHRLPPREEARTYLRLRARRGEFAAAAGHFRRLATSGDVKPSDVRDLALGLARAVRARVGLRAGRRS